MNNVVIWSHAISIEQFAPGGIRRPFHKLDYYSTHNCCML